MSKVNDGGQFFVGVVEDRNDPLELHRVKVRVVGLHTHDNKVLPTKDLPWAFIMQSPGETGSTIAPPEGTTVIVVFNDWPDCQMPIVIGKLIGIDQPPDKVINVDSFEQTPAYVDAITPQGRPVPTTSAEVNGNQIGPVTGNNPALNAIAGTGAAPVASGPKPDIVTTTSAGNSSPQTTNDSKTTVGSVGSGLNSGLTSITSALSTLNGFIQPSVHALGAVGKMAGAVNGLGTTFVDTKNTFENLVIGSGSSLNAMEQFKLMMTQSGKEGNAIASILNAKSDFKSFKTDLQNTKDNLKSSFSSISGGLDTIQGIQGLLTNIERITVQISSEMQAAQQQITAIENEFTFYAPTTFATGASGVSGLFSSLGASGANFLSLAGSGIKNLATGTVAALTQNAKDLFNSDIAQFKGIISAGVLQFEDAKTEFMKTFKFTGATQVNPAGLDVVQNKKPEEPVTSADFKDVGEGTTPPINGAYGGPNFGGGSAPVVPPSNPANDIIKFSPTAGGQGDIPTEPPPWWKGDRAKATAGIQALLAAADEHKFTKEQKAALLGIVGGESNWIPQEESCQYSSPQRLCTIFQSTFKGDINLAEKYCNWLGGGKGTRKDFFNFVYHPSNNGKKVGNKLPDDGGKFYGKGFIQLTGRPNYEYYSNVCKVDLVNNPDLLNTDLALSAKVAVQFFLNAVPKSAVPTAHPNYYYAARDAVGHNDPIVAARKLTFYEYFYGVKAPESYKYTDQQAGNTVIPHSYDGAMAADRMGLPKTGFMDPHGKYPKRRKNHQQSNSKLARGIVEDTIVSLKESKKITGIPVAGGGLAWDEPSTSFAACYPYNHVRETESGHVQEFDDTPGHERIHTYHRSGTFEEIDPNGSKITKIVGDGYTIFDRNGNIYIKGNANVTCAGNINILCQSDANIEVTGSAEMKVGGSLDIGVARDMNIAVEGDFSLWTNGNMNLQSKKAGHIRSNENMYVSSNQDMHLYTEGKTFVETFGELNLTAHDTIYATSGNDVHLYATNDIFAASTNTNLKSSGDIRLGGSSLSVSASDILLGGTTTGSFRGDIVGTASYATTAGAAPDGAAVVVHGDLAVPDIATEATISKPATKALVHGMIPPAIGFPLRPILEPLHAPPMLGEEKMMYEFPIDGQSNISKLYNQQMQSQYGLCNQRVIATTMGSGGAGTIIPSPRQSEILACTEFTADYRLSEHFTLGMMFDGGFNVKHKLVPQNGLTVQQIVANLSALCENILEKYITVLPDGIHGLGRTWRIGSGYRMASAGIGSPTSDHPMGRAVDISLVGGPERKALHHNLIMKLDKLVPYDQLILEYAAPEQTWIHTGFKGSGTTTFGGGSNRGMQFTMRDHKSVGQGFILLA